MFVRSSASVLAAFNRRTQAYGRNAGRLSLLVVRDALVVVRSRRRCHAHSPAAESCFSLAAAGRGPAATPVAFGRAPMARHQRPPGAPAARLRHAEPAAAARAATPAAAPPEC